MKGIQRRVDARSSGPTGQVFAAGGAGWGITAKMLIHNPCAKSSRFSDRLEIAPAQSASPHFAGYKDACWGFRNA
jgi:hypothetical protein